MNTPIYWMPIRCSVNPPSLAGLEPVAEEGEATVAGYSGSLRSESRRQ